MIDKKLILFLIILLQLFLTVCSDRVETPSDGENSTTIYHSKSVNGIEASITFCEKIKNQTGEPVNEDTIFNLNEDSKVYSIVNLKNRELNTDKDLMFHIDWLDSTGNSFFKKRIDLTTNDSSSTLMSLINISPDRREPGKYSLRVYLFRELIAEKNFELVNAAIEPQAIVKNELIEKVKANITLCKGISKKTKKLLGVGNKFEIKDKGKVLAVIKIENKDSINHPLTFYADWISPDGSSLYRKEVNIKSNEASFSSSISASPNKRKPGKYCLRIYLFEKLIGEKSFGLVKTEKQGKAVSEVNSENFSARIIFCEKISKKTGLPINPDSVFTLKDKRKLRAVIYIEKSDTIVKIQKSFFIKWIGSDNNSFYKKKVRFSPEDSTLKIISSISLSPQKRLPGNYLLKVYYTKDLIGEKKFLLKEQAEK
ncbi:MAG: hypothetical protein OQJ93_02430 [Ignavibacteriaceae bacterium]|nr:hypothetical protein [Ignavibacteriaceae bacterium]MCW8813199.1 hypothetical protein [Chlorobium sp.]MCW8816756.1 hypothetical protein [Ignavibacteriaceae bacterium]MCW8960988.1 hypothetical protein [Ignavibacteriaceae bacterium]MCW9096221.1 hypothetical protein [Ignavibacteriaceae bacterium]